MFTVTFDQLIVVLTGLLGGVGTLATVIGAIYPMWQERQNRARLQRMSQYSLFDKSTIHSAIRGYVRPKCQNLDPAQEQELRHALVATREDLFRKVDYFLDHEHDKRHLFVLAESGIGKTSFSLNYYAHNESRKSFKHKIFLIPLGHPKADEKINQINNRDDIEDIVLFLDALDEDIKAINNHGKRIGELALVSQNCKKIIITCRTQFFLKDEEIPLETGIMRFGSRKAGDKGTYEFWKIYLSPFDDNDIAMFVKKYYSFWKYGIKTHRLRNQALTIAKRIPMLSVRPMLLAHIPDLVNHHIDLDQGDALSITQLYETMINAWIERETAWDNKSELRDFSERIAVEMVIRRSDRGMERIPYDELDMLARIWNIKMQPWKISGRSLLNRDSDGNFKFAHRSIMEYLFVEKYVKGDARCYGIPLTDQMLKFFFTKTGHQPKLKELEGIITNFFASTSTKTHTEIFIDINSTISSIVSASMRAFGIGCKGSVILHHQYQDPKYIRVSGRIINSLLISDINNSIGSMLGESRNMPAFSGEIDGLVHSAMISLNVRKPLIDGKPFFYESNGDTKNIMISSPICLSEDSDPDNRMGVMIVEYDKSEDEKRAAVLLSEMCRRIATVLLFADRSAMQKVV